ncbi:hypothetical protein [Allonocardiopsis opalescens]|uniref:Uncharacterized protein n=1 Tax=Allonocardiopsis opalescens TaxID=1144618 RepID=A0A2T0PT01_9ACTN|nr:hypothetical protein [Allonocardiopsis opalescens]PRX92034.1 hypothetical protein CLV72_112107 [Allonocardiopsis opalescens]
MDLTQSETEDLRSALSCAFGADLADEFSEDFLICLVSRLPATVIELADEWTWNDTEVREAACAEAERLLGVADMAPGETPRGSSMRRELPTRRGPAQARTPEC